METLNVRVNSIIPIPAPYLDLPVKVKITVLNESITFNITPIQLGSSRLAQHLYNEIANGLPYPFSLFGTLLANLFFSVFGISAILRNNLRLLGIGGIAYGAFIAPGLLDLGFPLFPTVMSALVAIGVGLVAIWASTRSTS